mmetsp:Transcript_4933/g.12240  ORF Transcript_4933/g.12240 Transcript_4933/m.12240 type:complete len:218 (+) Transcript_4933:717-1370(+)
MQRYPVVAAAVAAVAVEDVRARRPGLAPIGDGLHGAQHRCAALVEATDGEAFYLLLDQVGRRAGHGALDQAASQVVHLVRIHERRVASQLSVARSRNRLRVAKLVAPPPPRRVAARYLCAAFSRPRTPLGELFREDVLAVGVPHKARAARPTAVDLPPVAVGAQHGRHGLARHGAAGEANLGVVAVHADVEAQQLQPAAHHLVLVVGPDIVVDDPRP